MGILFGSVLVGSASSSDDNRYSDWLGALINVLMNGKGHVLEHCVMVIEAAIKDGPCFPSLQHNSSLASFSPNYLLFACIPCQFFDEI